MAVKIKNHVFNVGDKVHVVDYSDRDLYAAGFADERVVPDAEPEIHNTVIQKISKTAVWINGEKCKARNNSISGPHAKVIKIGHV